MQESSLTYMTYGAPGQLFYMDDWSTHLYLYSKLG